MKFVVLIVLAALWAVVLVPPLLRARTSRSNDSIGDFNYKLGVLSRTNGLARRRGGRLLPVLSSPSPVFASPSTMGPRLTPSQRAAKRRRDITLGLTVAAALTLAIATFAQSTSVWLLQGVTDVLLVGYLGLLAWARSLQLDRSATVRYLPERAPELALRPAPELALRRTASS